MPVVISKRFYLTKQTIALADSAAGAQSCRVFTIASNSLRQVPLTCWSNCLKVRGEVLANWERNCGRQVINKNMELKPLFSNESLLFGLQAFAEFINAFAHI